MLIFFYCERSLEGGGGGGGGGLKLQIFSFAIINGKQHQLYPTLAELYPYRPWRHTPPLYHHCDLIITKLGEIIAPANFLFK